MSGLLDYKVLATTHSREALLNYAEQNGVEWEESNHEGVNWMRASASIVKHLDNKKEFFTDNLTPELIQSLTEMYTKLKEVHQTSMIPTLRSAMQKLKEEADPATHPMDTLEDAHVHLAANGGATWADKIFVLRTINTQLAYLESRAQNIPQVEESK